MYSRYIAVYEGLTHLGRTRSGNEDELLCAGAYLPARHGEASFRGQVTAGERGALFGVFDGMGGEAFGEEAAFLAASSAAAAPPGAEDMAAGLLRSVHEMDRAVCDWARKEGVAAMGTTAVMIGLTGAEAVICNIGDSRAYLFRDGTLKMLSEDHVVKRPGQKKGPLTRWLGTGTETDILMPCVRIEPLRAGDVYLMCTDGLTDMVGDDEILWILREHGRGAAGPLLNAALAAGGRDNVTVIVIGITARPGRAPGSLRDRVGRLGASKNT
ncbi:MAG: serine/threonine-protein phosphatase [Clostridia bacterium]|nr:serine/threonine-protein phosphatase [Clostridia bacterium]